MTELDLSQPLSQATTIEQTRAAMEVQAAIVAAKNLPRDLVTVRRLMHQAGDQLRLAERAWYRYPREGKQISGLSIVAARELVRCWGNVKYGVWELARDDQRRQSEVKAFAWDLETNTNAERTLIIPHRRDTKEQRGKPLLDLRDIAENNASQGGRALRECLLGILPRWYVVEAEERLHATLERGESSEPLEVRVDKIIALFEQEYNVTRDQLESKLGRLTPQWTTADLATLRVIGGSLHRGEVTVSDEFPKQRVTFAELTGEDHEEKKP